VLEALKCRSAQGDITPKRDWSVSTKPIKIRAEKAAPVKLENPGHNKVTIAEGKGISD